MQTLIVAVIIVAAAGYVGWVFYRGFKQKDGCACGCSCCSIADSCTLPPARDARDSVNRTKH
jgi:hypothetical protein